MKEKALNCIKYYMKICLNTGISFLILLELLPLLLLLQLGAVVVMGRLPSFVVSFEAFIKLIVGLLAKIAGGGGNVVGNCVGWDIIPLALFAMYMEFVEYIAFGRAKSIYFPYADVTEDSRRIQKTNSAIWIARMADKKCNYFFIIFFLINKSKWAQKISGRKRKRMKKNIIEIIMSFLQMEWKTMNTNIVHHLFLGLGPLLCHMFGFEHCFRLAFECFALLSLLFCLTKYLVYMYKCRFVLSADATIVDKMNVNKTFYSPIDRRSSIKIF